MFSLKTDHLLVPLPSLLGVLCRLSRSFFFLYYPHSSGPDPLLAQPRGEPESFLKTAQILAFGK